MNSERMTFEDAAFDEIHAWDVLEHVDNLDAVLNEICRVLKPGGILIANVPHKKSQYYFSKIRPSYLREIHHVRIFDDRELEDLLKTKNLTLTKKMRTGFLTHLELIKHAAGNRQLAGHMDHEKCPHRRTLF